METLKFVTLVTVLVVQVQHSIQLRSTHPLHHLVETVNNYGGPYIGLLMAYPTEEAALVTSRFFVPSSNVPSIDLAGRRFNIGKIKGVDVIYVMSGEQTLNAGITVQILLDVFDIKGIVHYGTAGSANDSLFTGDVSVPLYIAFTGSWKWKELQSPDGWLAELEFGNYNLPEKGENSLAKIEYTYQQLYSNGKPMQQVFWLPVDANWFSLATQLQELDFVLQQCLNETFCLPTKPKVVYRLRGSTADIFVDNAAYRKFLFNKFNISTVDEESSAVVMTSITNGVPCIVFRGVSDLAGAGNKLESTSSSSLAALNALSVAVEFICLVGQQPNLRHDD
ncbi:bark storage A-like [Olea europaea subsp. europaea]|uniref:Bark storage A-like n=2 Tax=Olea europaea subsp. europaea TaxID=158383 RepID=A0A8S0QJD0_OLEEU|nr:bark storage A-like [Olea europaea subsp. europaea]